MLSSFKPAIDRITQRLVAPLEHINPDLLTLMGIVPSLLFFLFIILHLYLWALFVYIFNIFDMLDGAVAKRFHKKTDFGAFLDSTMDRIADFFIITSFGFAGVAQWWIVLSLLLCSYLVSYARSRAELASGAKQIFAIGLIERTERLALVWLSLLAYVLSPAIAIFNLNLLELIFLLITFLSAITFIQRVIAAYKRL